MMDFEGKVVLITGGRSGIGAACAMALRKIALSSACAVSTSLSWPRVIESSDESLLAGTGAYGQTRACDPDCEDEGGDDDLEPPTDPPTGPGLPGDIYT